MRQKPLIAVSCIALLLSGCLTPTGKQKPAELVTYGSRGGAGSTGMHTVLEGDTVYTVSQRYNLPLRDIITANNLSAPYHLPRGYRIKLPPPNEYRVRKGDTLNGVSRLFSASVSEMARLNDLPAPYVVKTGQILRLPSQQPKLQEEFAANVPPPTFSVTTEQVAPISVGAVESEVLPPPPGQSVETASVTPVLSAPTGAAAPQAVTPAAGFPPQPIPQSPATTVTTPTPQAKVQTASLPPSVAPKVPPRIGNGKFMRPVDGKIISGFGPKDDGLHNDGINIKAPKGTAVRAADNGVVAYTGSGMSGYGNLVLIRHQGRWMTAYAHMDKTLVKKGDVVKAGQSIGTVGASGQVDSPQLHFEVRKGTQAVNPSSYL